VAEKQSPPKKDPQHPSEEDSSPVSGTASPADAGGLIEDPGPAFDPGQVEEEPEAPEDEEQLPELEEAWDVQVIKGLLETKGRTLHAVAGVAEDDWVYTEIDLAAIAPPLTRIFNRYPAIRRYAALGDPILLATAYGAYTARSVDERRTALAAAAPVETEVPLPPAEGPPPPAAQPSVPPPAPRPSAFPGAEGQAPPPAPAPRTPSSHRQRPGEADIDPEGVDWQVGGG
jgi:hypothetical protein